MNEVKRNNFEIFLCRNMYGMFATLTNPSESAQQAGFEPQWYYNLKLVESVSNKPNAINFVAFKEHHTMFYDSIRDLIRRKCYVNVGKNVIRLNAVMPGGIAKTPTVRFFIPEIDLPNADELVKRTEKAHKKIQMN